MSFKRKRGISLSHHKQIDKITSPAASSHSSSFQQSARPYSADKPKIIFTYNPHSLHNAKRQFAPFENIDIFSMPNQNNLNQQVKRIAVNFSQILTKVDKKIQNKLVEATPINYLKSEEPIISIFKKQDAKIVNSTQKPEAVIHVQDLDNKVNIHTNKNSNQSQFSKRKKPRDPQKLKLMEQKLKQIIQICDKSLIE